MDEGWAVVAGAGIAFAGVAVAQIIQERRARVADRRADTERDVRVRGMARMVASELKGAHIRIRNAPLSKLSEDVNLSTSSWDRYGPDIAARYSWDVVHKVQMAYAVLEVFMRGLTGTRTAGVSDATIAMVAESGERERAELLLQAREESRRKILEALAMGYDALRPYVGDSDAPLPPLDRPEAVNSSGDAPRQA